MLRRWEELPGSMQVDEVRKYYEILQRKRGSLFWKRVFDMVVSLILLILLSPVFLILAVAIKIDSKGPVFYRQVRVTQYGRKFRIHKFRSMINRADEKGSLVTVGNDSRITRVGRLIRDKRLDELPQLIDVLQGNMSFVGVRPEVPKYVKEYTPEMRATLLLPAGITNLTSIYYKDEAKLLNKAGDPDKVYIEEILPKKMEWNLRGIEEFGFWRDVRTMIETVFVVF
ncbi:MAG: sugar transferase [Lachnospiraceae bacterium]|nr:sugar transferase [Lachnospiraceae bacterium]